MTCSPLEANPDLLYLYPPFDSKPNKTRFHLRNRLDLHMAFRVKSRQRRCMVINVSPSSGYMRPKETLTMTVTLEPMVEGSEGHRKVKEGKGNFTLLLLSLPASEARARRMWWDLDDVPATIVDVVCVTDFEDRVSLEPAVPKDVEEEHKRRHRIMQTERFMEEMKRARMWAAGLADDRYQSFVQDDEQEYDFDGSFARQQVRVAQYVLQVNEAYRCGLVEDDHYVAAGPAVRHDQTERPHHQTASVLASAPAVHTGAPDCPKPAHGGHHRDRISTPIRCAIFRLLITGHSSSSTTPFPPFILPFFLIFSTLSYFLLLGNSSLGSSQLDLPYWGSSILEISPFRDLPFWGCFPLRIFLLWDISNGEDPKREDPQ